MQRPHHHDSEDRLLNESIYIFAILSLCGVITLQGGWLPQWANWTTFAVTVGGGLAASILFLLYKWPTIRAKKIAEAIRLKAGDTGPFALSVADIAAKVGSTPAATAKALLLLEQQGFARRSTADTWHIGRH